MLPIHLGKQWETAQEPVPLAPVWESGMEFQASEQAIEAFRGMNQQMGEFSVSPPLSLSFSNKLRFRKNRHTF